jgi:putative sigma-54 modulation protein
VRKHRGGYKSRAKDIIAEDTLHLDEEGPVRIRVRGIEYKPMDVEEAIMQMDLVTNNFLVFTNARTDQVNVLYRRKDGDYGLIQPRI